MSLAYQIAHIHDSYQPDLIAATVVCSTAAHVAVAVRFVSRRVGHVKFGWDDICIVIALVCIFMIVSCNAPSC